MITSNFRQLSRLPYTPEMVSIFDALGFDQNSIPHQYIPRRFRANGCLIDRQDDDHYLCYRPWRKPTDPDPEQTDARGSSQLIGASSADYEAGTHEQGAGAAVLKWIGFVSGSPADHALRRWLTLWGWRDPKDLKAAADAPTAKPMVI